MRIIHRVVVNNEESEVNVIFLMKVKTVSKTIDCFIYMNNTEILYGVDI